MEKLIQRIYRSQRESQLFEEEMIKASNREQAAIKELNELLKPIGMKVVDI